MMAKGFIRSATMFAAALLAGPWGPQIGQGATVPGLHHRSRATPTYPRHKRRAVSVAAMKRAACKARNRSRRNG